MGAVYLSGQINRLKAWRLWCRFMLVDCYGRVVNQDVVLYRNLLKIGSVQRGT